MSESVIKHLVRRVVNIAVVNKNPREADAAVERAVRDELAPLLDVAKKAAESIRNDLVYLGFKKELEKWLK